MNDAVKKHLLGRLSTIEAAITRGTANVLLQEQRLTDARGELAAAQGAAEEVRALLTFLDSTQPPRTP